jgi:glutamate-1-semialdehyde 2,1-aminomutase
LSDRAPHSSEAGVLIGSLGNRRCFDQLCATISSAGVALDWYNGSVHDYDHTTQYHGLRDDPERRRQVMIRPCGLLPEDQLAETVRTYPYALIPTGALDESGDDNPRLWRLSFAVAAANLPVIVLGSETTSAARFVRQFEVGVICDYRGDRLRDAIARVTDIETRRRMRRHAAAVGPRFSARGVNAWLWASLDLDRPRDLRFEELLPRPPASPPPGQRVDARGVP